MEHFIQATVALIAIADPLGAVPFFLSMIPEGDRRAARREAFRASFYVLVILASAALIGTYVLKAFGISFPAFQAAGGLIIILMGLEMLGGTPTRVQHDKERFAEAEDKIFVPFAMPLVAGPGAITAVVTMAVKDKSMNGLLMVLSAVLATAIFLWITLLLSAYLSRWISSRGRRILLRFMGLLLVAVGFQLLLGGVQTFFIPEK